jgi:phytoene dehydrogenase-like protein
VAASYDAIVIGAGHNGLTTAAFLAKSGKRVLVIERRDTVGGLCAADEFHGGYRTAGLLHDTSGVRRWVADALGLDQHGLAFESTPSPVFMPMREGSGLLLHHDPGQAEQEIAAFSKRDAERYREFRAFIARVRGAINNVLDNDPPDFMNLGDRGNLWQMGRRGMGVWRLGKRDTTELLRIAPMAVADWLGEWFETDVLKAALAGPAVYGTFTGPRSPGSAFNLLVYECRQGAAVKGGAGALVAALEKAARANGVEIRTGAEVERIAVENGVAKGVVLDGGEEVQAQCVAASSHPTHALLGLLPAGTISLQLEERMTHFRSSGTTAKVHIALDKPFDLAARTGERFARVRTGEHLDDLEKAFDATKYGEASAVPVLDIHVPSATNGGFAPDGHDSLSVLVNFAPYRVKEPWDEKAHQALGEAVVDTLAAYAPGVAKAIVAIEVLAPPDIEERFALPGGHIHHGEHAIDQLLVRPVPECAQYATPVAGLYLCGSGSFPGGGITCAPGALAARAILKR